MKRILFYTDTNFVGGAEHQMLILAKFLKKDMYEITLACSGEVSLNGWCQQFIEAGFNVIRLKVLHKHDPRHFLYVKKMLPRFDLIHIHIWNPASCRYALAAAANSKKIVITEHDPFRLNRLKGYVKKKLMEGVQRVIVASEGAKESFLMELPQMRERVTVVRNGIDVVLWREHQSISRSEFRRNNFAITGNEKVVLCVAELHARKGQHHLLSAWHILARSIQDAKLVFVGDGGERMKYETLARRFSRSVLFLGRRKDIAELMHAADYLVLPSVREAFGLVILEAALSNLPVIASDTGGIPEIVTDRESGRLVPPEDPEKLADALREIMAEPQHARSYAAALRLRVERDFTAQKMAEETEKVYGALLHDIS